MMEEKHSSKKDNHDGKKMSVGNRVTVRDIDVLCGRGQVPFKHVGNRYFRAIVVENIDEYSKCVFSSQRATIVQNIIDTIHSFGGRFLQQDFDSDEWVEMPKRRYRNKVAHAMRDAARHMMDHHKEQKPKPNNSLSIYRQELSVLAESNKLQRFCNSPAHDLRISSLQLRESSASKLSNTDSLDRTRIDCPEFSLNIASLKRESFGFGTRSDQDTSESEVSYKTQTSRQQNVDGRPDPCDHGKRKNVLKSCNIKLQAVKNWHVGEAVDVAATQPIHEERGDVESTDEESDPGRYTILKNPTRFPFSNNIFEDISWKNYKKDKDACASLSTEIKNSSQSSDDDPFLRAINDILGPLDESDLSLDTLLVSSHCSNP